jgi:hypothetical protein
LGAVGWRRRRGGAWVALGILTRAFLLLPLGGRRRRSTRFFFKGICRFFLASKHDEMRRKVNVETQQLKAADYCTDF